ncbi:MAG TPA: hypothetical protein VFB37_08205 [Steroidobacteraceae bacterium]|nr:hypothetical protein [Steroidobacteraceae bacterium]
MNNSNRLAAGAWLAAGVATLLMFACSSQKAPAEQAVADIDTSLGAVHDTAAKYSPEMLQNVEGQVATLKGNLAKGDYKEVLAAAPAVNTAITSLKQDADTKQAAADAALAQTKQQWRTLSTDVPKMVDAIKAQVDTLSKSHRLPKGVTKASLESAKSGVAALDSQWTDATNAVSNEDYAGAVAKGQAVKDKATDMMKSLDMKTS